MFKKILIGAPFLLLLLIISIGKVKAANTTMNIIPSSGSISKEFSVSLTIDGNGDKFNAAEASVVVSKGLSVKDLVLGDCKFSYLSTPSTTSPSFQGVILGGSSTKCTVYTLTVVPIQKGNATITLENAMVRRYGDAGKILKSVKSGSYINTEVLSASISNILQAEKSKEGLYSVTLKIISFDNNVLKNTEVIFKSATGGFELREKTDNTGVVRYKNLQPGIYTATVRGERTIINLTGKNHGLVLGIKLKSQNLFTALIDRVNPWVISGILIIIMIILTVKLNYWERIRDKFIHAKKDGV